MRKDRGVNVLHDGRPRGNYVRMNSSVNHQVLGSWHLALVVLHHTRLEKMLRCQWPTRDVE